MNDLNPYASPSEGALPRPEPTGDFEAGELDAWDPAYWVGETVVPRYLAASLDNAITFVTSIVAAKSVSDEFPLLQTATMVAAYLGYYFAFEGWTSRTPGKFLTGLRVVRLDGARPTWRQTAIRTAFRVLEADPLVLGGIPGALSIVASPRRQRFGDKVGRTLVVHSNRLPRGADVRGKRPRGDP